VTSHRQTMVNLNVCFPLVSAALVRVCLANLVAIAIGFWFGGRITQ
jgi:hypothetical protein